MNKQAALYKLATLRLAINYVLRSRMVKQANVSSASTGMPISGQPRYTPLKMNFEGGKYYGRGAINTWGPQIAQERATIENNWKQVPEKYKPKWEQKYNSRIQALDNLESNWNEFNTLYNNRANRLQYENGHYAGVGSVKTWQDRMNNTRRRLDLEREMTNPKQMTPAKTDYFNKRFTALNEFDQNFSPIAQYKNKNYTAYYDANTGNIVGETNPDEYERSIDTIYNLSTKDNQQDYDIIAQYNNRKKAVDAYRQKLLNTSISSQIEPGYTRPWAQDIWNYNPESTSVPENVANTYNDKVYASGVSEEEATPIANEVVARREMAPYSDAVNFVLSNAARSFYQSNYKDRDNYITLGGYDSNPDYTKAINNIGFDTADVSGETVKDNDYYYHSPSTVWHELGHRDYDSLFDSLFNNSILSRGYQDYKKIQNRDLTYDSIPENDRKDFDAGQKEVARTEYPSTLQQLGYLARSPEHWLDSYEKVDSAIRNVLGGDGIYKQINQFENLGYVDPSLEQASGPNYNAEQPSFNPETVNEMKKEIEDIVNDPTLDEDTKRLKYHMILKKNLPSNLYNMAMKGISMPVTRTASEIKDPRYQEARQWLIDKLKQQLGDGSALPWNVRQYLMKNDIDPSLDFSNPGNVLTFEQLRELYRILTTGRFTENREGNYGTGWGYGA